MKTFIRQKKITLNHRTLIHSLFELFIQCIMFENRLAAPWIRVLGGDVLFHVEEHACIVLILKICFKRPIL